MDAWWDRVQSSGLFAGTWVDVVVTVAALGFGGWLLLHLLFDG